MAEVAEIADFPAGVLRRIAGFYVGAGWVAPGADVSFLLPALRGSAMVVGAFEDGEIIGIGRALSDGCSDAYIQDVVVDPAHRGQGIGRQLIEALVSGLRARGIDWIALIGEPGTEGFYRRLNMRERPGFTMWQPDNR